MPFYEYECANCKFYLEVMQKISETPLKKCPSCGKSALKKLISAPVFRLKGGGWYETDFKSDNESKRNLAGGDEGSDSKAREAPAAADAKAGDAPAGKAADSKSEAKPAAKTGSSDSGAGGVASRSASKSAAAKPAKSAAKPAARAAARKPAPKAKAKAKASKRRGR
jgi:putative FmdB family regulatory protein